MNKLLTLLAAALLALGPGLFHGCQSVDGGTEIPNELRGRELIAGTGKPAADAEVRLIPVGYVPGEDSSDALFTARTDAEGRFVFKDLPPGQYNILAAKDGLLSYRDSVTVASKGQTLPADTLKAPGTLSGKVKLQPQHDPRTATVQVLGTTIFVNVGQDGSFALPGMGAGEYRLRVVTILPNYVPLFRVVMVRSGAESSLAEPLEPFYAGIPVVTGLKATADSADGTIRIVWEKSPYPNVQAYLIYRDDSDGLLPSTSPIARIKATAFTDTIYSRSPRSNQRPYADSNAYSFEYRVRILDLSGETGPAFGSAPVTAIPPVRTISMLKWKEANLSAPFPGRRDASLLVHDGKLWMLGGYGNQGHLNDLWSSADGISWDKVLDSLPFQDSARYLRAVAFRDSLWIVRETTVAIAQPGGEILTRIRLQAWNSADGITWRKITDSLPVPTRYRFNLAVHAGRLWILGGYWNGPAPTYHSEDGHAWTRFGDGKTPGGSLQAAVLSGRLLAMDSTGVMWWADSGGWTQVGTRLRSFLEYASTFLAHEGRLWVVGADYNYDQVWSSADGVAWDLRVAESPFGNRAGMSAISFRERLWAIGGVGPFGFSNDVWFLESP